MTSSHWPEASTPGELRRFETRLIAREALVETVRFEHAVDIHRQLIVAKTKCDRAYMYQELQNHSIATKHIENDPSENSRPDVSIVGFDTLCKIIQSPYRDHMVEPSRYRGVYLLSPTDTQPERISRISEVFASSRVQQFIDTTVRPKRPGPTAIDTSDSPRPTFDTPLPGWERDMACSGLGVDRSLRTTDAAVERELVSVVCGLCPVRDSCLSAGLAVDRTMQNAKERWGVWGGLTVGERKSIASLLRRGLVREATTYVQRKWART